MAVKSKWIIEKMRRWAPEENAEPWDNVGLLIGDVEQEINKVLIALDASQAVVREAVDGRYDLLITHHPLLFKPVNRITRQEVLGRKIFALIQHNIGLYAAHTNLDIAEGGPNHIMFEKLGLSDKESLMETEKPGVPALGCVGMLNTPMRLDALAAFIEEKLSLKQLRYAGNPGTVIHKAGLCAGDASAARYMKAALTKNCDVYITGDLAYHDVQDALEMGLSLVDITHYAGEAPLVYAVQSFLRNAAELENIKIIVDASSVNGQVFW